MPSARIASFNLLEKIDFAMIWKNTSSRYGTLSITMHWLMLLLMAAVYACIELRELFPKGSDPREALKTWHFMLGLCVFFLVGIRLIIRVSGPVPFIQPEPAVWQQFLAKSMHIALYVLMITMPLLGWLMLSSTGKPIPLFGLQLPPLIAENKELSKVIKGIHVTTGTVGYYLIGLHALAALYHHYFMRDNTLFRMLPR